LTNGFGSDVMAEMMNVVREIPQVENRAVSTARVVSQVKERDLILTYSERGSRCNGR
jgi:hypothetical protein